MPHHTWFVLCARRRPAPPNCPPPRPPGGHALDATVAVVALQGAGQHGELVSERRRRGGGDPETALSEVLATQRGVHTDDGLAVRTTDKKRPRPRIGGLHRTGDGSPALWASVTSAFATPDTFAVVPREVIGNGLWLSRDASELWLGVPDAGRPRT
ncbi:hypothetical protein [Streptomyces sp. NBC_00063]|uniref:hypothetical protein n=1 Tax=Streptomyces sp. NBC_00063 TaxID=2975638 RepID=UPI003D750B57